MALPADDQLTPERALAAIGSRPEGLEPEEVDARRARFGANVLVERGASTLLSAIVAQLRSPLVLLLSGAALIAALVGEWTDTAVIVAIVLASVVISVYQDRRAEHTIARLRARVHALATVRRGGRVSSIPAADVVPGDVVLLGAGALVPADAILLEAADLFVNEAILTGESFPAEKRVGPHPPSASLSARPGWVWAGTSVRSGTAAALVVGTGRHTEVGRIAHRLVLRAPETDFDRGVRRFGMLLARVLFVLVPAVFAINALAAKPLVDSLLFALALAVGIAPEMLPAVVTTTLARGAAVMAKHGVVVKRLTAIESFGSMDVLCTDKTGTLTEGRVTLVGALEAAGEERSARVLELALANAVLHGGLRNPLDEALAEQASDSTLPAKVGEVPYDFARKRLSVIVEAEGRTLITKGAFVPVLALCSTVRRGELACPIDAEERARLSARYEAISAEGVRVLAVATRAVAEQPAYGPEDERELCLEGLLLFDDTPKALIREVVARVAAAGVAVKIVTGDNRYVAAHVARLVGLDPGEVMTAEAIDALTDEALPVAAERAVVFAELDPRQKERIVLALRKAGRVVGYMGDGINDAPALHAADVSISVDGATDVAREAADLVLLERDLEVLREGVLRGRTTFANTLKYLYTTESANFGNMISMAAASLFLPFLPMTAAQILLNNFLSDLPPIAIAGDAVDPEQTATPRRWDLPALRRLMLGFGAVSSVFDLLTFAVLLGIVGASPDQFRTAWFVESLLTELAVALVVRTQRRFWRSRPSPWLLGITVAVAIVAFVVPYVPYAARIGFVPLPASWLALLALITFAYVLTVETLKRLVFGRALTARPA